VRSVLDKMVAPICGIGDSLRNVGDLFSIDTEDRRRFSFLLTDVRTADTMRESLLVSSAFHSPYRLRRGVSHVTAS
jgi:hypothetical protein